jgi:LuxR family maltose regulon positive regulatory protein
MPYQPAQFTPPLINTQKMIRRPRLMAQIRKLSYRSILFIHDPAGYGKTTAAVQWIGKRKAGWFSLDEYSTMPVNFYRGILRALQAEIPDNFDEAPKESMLGSLQKIHDWPSVFAIDDFHLLSDSSAAAALPLIRSRMPVDTAFLILSRNPPPEALSAYILNGSIKELSGLQFTIEEICALFDKNKTTLSPTDAQMLYRQTDGWAAALSAILMSGEKVYTGRLNWETLNKYFRNYVFEYWESFDELKKCSVCDVLIPELCEAITGQRDIWEKITALANKTGLVTRYGDSYKFHAVLKEFLETELNLDKNIDKPQLYKKAAYWYIENGDWLHTLNMAAKIGDNDTIEEISRLVTAKNDNAGVDVEEYIKLVESNFLSIPVSIIEQYPRLSGLCFVVSFISRSLSEACMWADIHEEHMKKGLVNGADNIPAAFRRALDPRQSSWYVPEQFKRIGKILPAITRQSYMVTISLNFPFFHKGQRDYTDISRELPAYIAEVRRQMEPAVGPLIKVLAALIESGVLYERGDLSEAEAVALSIIKNVNNLPPELQFCTYVLYTEILRVQGKKIEPEIIRDMIERTGAHYLSVNFYAFETNISLHNGDETAAAKWLEQRSPVHVLQLYKIYRHFTTARAIMVKSRLSAAEKLLERFAVFSQDYRRNADYIEALTLRAICLWRVKRTAEAIKTMTAAIVKAAELQLVMPIVKDGGDVLPVLQKILNRLKYGYDSGLLDKAFVSLLYIKARNISKYTPGMFSRNKAKAVKLSPRQSEVMGYLLQNLSYQEISERMRVTKSAVEYHIRILHEKFDAANTRELLQKAQDLGFLDLR